MSGKRYPTWTYRLLRFRWVDYLGGGRWQLGVRYSPREVFTAGGVPFRALAFTVGPREYVFDLGASRG